jgi:TolB protein
VGYTLQLVAEIWDTTDAIIQLPRPIVWRSSDPTVATVTPYYSRTAIVTGVRAGSVKISATVEGKSDTAIVTIGKVGSVVVTPESATVAVHGTIQLSVTLLDLQGRILSGGPITWRSTEPTVATVDSTGMVRGVGTGATSVIAASERVSDTSAIAAWLVPGGRIVFRSDRDGNLEIYAMNADGSGVERLTNDGASDGGPAWSPDGLKIAFDRAADPNADTHAIYVMNRDGSEVNALFAGTDPAWSRDGTRIAAAGESVSVLCGRICVSRTVHRIVAAHPDGSGLVVLTSSGVDREPSWSPDGRIAFTNTSANGSDIFAINADGTGLTNLTNDPAADESPAWSPDGTKIVFRSNRTGVYDLYVMNADGSGVTALTADSAAEGRPAWSPDGAKLAFASNRSGNYEIYVMNADGSGVVRLTDNPAVDARPAWAR